MAEVDWSKVTVPPKVLNDPRIFTSRMAELDYLKFVIASKLMERSLGNNAASALTAYVARHWERHLEALTFEAQKKGLSTEAYISQLLGEGSKKDIGKSN